MSRKYRHTSWSISKGKYNHVANSKVHIEHHRVLYYGIIYILAIPSNKEDVHSGLKTSDQRSAIRSVITVIDWRLTRMHVFSQLLLVDVLFDTCIRCIQVIYGFILIRVVVFKANFIDRIAKFTFYANCRFSAVKGLISIFYIANQIKNNCF